MVRDGSVDFALVLRVIETVMLFVKARKLFVEGGGWKGTGFAGVAATSYCNHAWYERI